MVKGFRIEHAWTVHGIKIDTAATIRNPDGFLNFWNFDIPIGFPFFMFTWMKKKLYVFIRFNDFSANNAVFEISVVGKYNWNLINECIIE